MFCKICEKFNPKKPFGIEGSTNFKVSTLATHDGSKSHDKAIEN